MTVGLRVVRVGPGTAVQDLGRFGHQRFGVPPAGALDGISLRLANALVGNRPDAAGLEILFQGPDLVVEAPAARIALVGPFAGGLPPWRSHTARAGDVLRPGRAKGLGYMAIAGGLALTPVLGSVATYARAAFGGLEGRSLRDGDLLPLAVPMPEGPDRTMIPALAEQGPVRIVLGPQDDFFDADAIAQFLATDYNVARDSDRMGLRLEGPPLRHAKGADIVSDGIATGCIQVPGNGLPIVLLADRGTVGGYPKIATVISADLPRVGRMVAGGRISFQAVSAAAAVGLRRDQERRLERLIGAIHPVDDLLHAENLISGVVGPDDGSST